MSLPSVDPACADGYIFEKKRCGCTKKATPKKRCPNGTRRNKQGVCVPKTAPQPAKKLPAKKPPPKKPPPKKPPPKKKTSKKKPPAKKPPNATKKQSKRKMRAPANAGKKAATSPCLD